MHNNTECVFISRLGRYENGSGDEKLYSIENICNSPWRRLRWRVEEEVQTQQKSSFEGSDGEGTENRWTIKSAQWIGSLLKKKKKKSWLDKNHDGTNIYSEI